MGLCYGDDPAFKFGIGYDIDLAKGEHIFFREYVIHLLALAFNVYRFFFKIARNDLASCDHTAILIEPAGQPNKPYAFGRVTRKKENMGSPIAWVIAVSFELDE